MADGVPSPRRFEIALSFPGEYRNVVEAVATLLAEKFTQARVLYDEYHDAEFARLNLKTYLPSLYLDHSELIVVFLCPEYVGKKWCKLEWRNVSEMIESADQDRIMLVSFGKLGRIPELGILEGDGKLDITGMSPTIIAGKILKRLALNPGHTPSASTPAPSPNHGPIHLPQPRLGDLFTGRADDLEHLSATHFTKPYQPGQKPLVLHGPPGVGKTTLACELLYHLHDRQLLSHIHHIPAADPAALPTLLADLAATVGAVSTAQGPVDPAAAHRELVNWLAQSAHAGKVLLYFDNADTPAARDAVLAEIRSLGHPRALVTSRRGDWPQANLHPVTTWPPAQAAEYLRKCLPDLSGPDVQLLTGALGGLPLAFDLAVALIKNQHYPVPDLLDLFRTKLADQKIPGREGNPTVAALLAMSMESLEENARELLQILSFYAPQPIPEKLIAGSDTDGWRESLAALHAASLLTWENTGHTVSLHPFFRDAILQGIPSASWETSFTRAAKILWQYLPNPEWTPDRWQEWPLLLPHCAAFADHARHPRLAPALASPWVSTLAKILGETGTHYQHRAAYVSSEAFTREALRIDRAAYGDDHPDVAIDLNNLAQLLQDTNRLSEAEPLMRDALRIDRAAYGDDHPKVAIRLNNLAQLLKATNRLSEAEPMMRDALRIDRAAYGDDHPEVARDLNNLAQLLQDSNRPSEAEPLMREGLQIEINTKGIDHPHVAIQLSNLAQLLKATNRLGEAEPLMRDALRIDRAAYGDDHPDVAIDLNNLAGLLEATNRLSEAEPLMRDALRIDRAAYGEDHPEIARDLNNLAQLLKATNRLSEADPLMRDALRILHDSLGPEHPNTVTVSRNLEALLEEMKDLPPEGEG